MLHLSVKKYANPLKGRPRVSSTIFEWDRLNHLNYALMHALIIDSHLGFIAGVCYHFN